MMFLKLSFKIKSKSLKVIEYSDMVFPDNMKSQHVPKKKHVPRLSRRDEGVVQPHPSKKVTTLVQKMEESEALVHLVRGDG